MTRRTVCTWPVSDQEAPPTDVPDPDYTSVCSAISSASSTSMPKYRTAPSNLLCPSKSWAARRFFVRRLPVKQAQAAVNTRFLFFRLAASWLAVIASYTWWYRLCCAVYCCFSPKRAFLHKAPAINTRNLTEPVPLYACRHTVVSAASDPARHARKVQALAHLAVALAASAGLDPLHVPRSAGLLAERQRANRADRSHLAAN